MFGRLFLAGLAIFFCGLCACGNKSTNPDTSPPKLDSIHWVGSSIVYDTTVIKKDHSVMFFLASWCGWCKKLKNETLTDTTVIRILNEHYNAVNIDPDADTLVAYQDTMVSPRYLAEDIYKVSGYPEIDIFNRSGDRIARLIGFRTAAAFVLELDRFRDKK